MPKPVDLQALVEGLPENQLCDLLATVAEELVQLSGKWIEQSKTEIAAGGTEFVKVLENSAEFHHMATDIGQRAYELEDYSTEIGVFD